MPGDKYLGTTLPFQKTEFFKKIGLLKKMLKENKLRNYGVLLIFLRYIVNVSYKLGCMGQN